MKQVLKQIMLEHGLHKNISEDCQHRVEMMSELIVRECADLFKLVHTDEQYARRIDKTILKHFGLYE
jgi:hypothetical protein